MKLKIPQFFTQRPAFLARKFSKPSASKRLHAATATRRMAPGVEDDYDAEPTTRLSSAFFVVLILHVVAVGGIYAFNSIKAHRRGLEPTSKSAQTKSGAKPVEQAPTGAGEEGVLPVKAGSGAETSLLPSGAATGSTGRIYQVKQGDSLTKIAQQSGVSVAELQMVNSPKEIAILRPGQTLNLPALKSGARGPATSAVEMAKLETPVKKAEPTSASSRTYAVQKGDTATSIARKLGVTVPDLLKLNKVTDPKKLQPGDSLKVPPKKG